MFIIPSREGVTQGDPLSMVLYGITLAPLAEELCASVLDLLAPLYYDDSALYGLSNSSVRLRTLLLEWGPAKE